jgi:cation:H+ antiporter
MAITVVLLVLGLVLLTVGGEFLVRSSSRLASNLGVSRLFIGLTVVAFGTSAPEAVVSVTAALRGASDLALGNVVGSCIFNVLFILGLSAIIVPLAVSSQLVRFEIPLLVAVSVMCFLLGLDGVVGRWDGALLLAVLVIHVTVSYHKGRRSGEDAVSSTEKGGPEALEGVPRPPSRWKGSVVNAVVLVVSLGLLVLGSRWLVESASTLARAIGLSEIFIGLTVVAVGTSLPEVATSVMAAARGQRDIAVGNVIGSSIFNILGVLGLSATVAPSGVSVAPAILAFDLPVMVAVAVLCLPIFFNGMTVFRWEGGLLFGYFVLYMAYILLRSLEHIALRDLATIVTWGVLPITGLTLVAVTVANLIGRARTHERRT